MPTKILTLDEVLSKYTDGPNTGIFTDGGSRPNPGPGGWGLVWVEGGVIKKQLYGAEQDTTNNRMEMTAIIQALKLYREDQPITLYTDSELCKNTLTKWAAGWEKNNWKKKSGPIKNLDLVKIAYELFQQRPNITIEWTAGHDGLRWNEYVDSLANAYARDEL